MTLQRDICTCRFPLLCEISARTRMPPCVTSTFVSAFLYLGSMYVYMFNILTSLATSECVLAHGRGVGISRARSLTALTHATHQPTTTTTRSCEF